MPYYNLEQAQSEPKGQIKDWLYNGLDVIGTRWIADTLLPRLNARQKVTYAFERALQGPAMSSMVRGINVDEYTRAKMVGDLKRELQKDVTKLGKSSQIKAVWDITEKETGICFKGATTKSGKVPHHKWPKGVPEEDRCCSVCGVKRLKTKPFNANSSDHVDHLFYDLFKIPIMFNKLKKRSTDGDILERMALKYPEHADIANGILAIRDKKKQLGTLNARLSKRGRYPSTFNIGAAWTGRLSASKSPFGEGGNSQNLASRHRKAFISDPGRELFYADLKQAESNVVAHLAGDVVYIDAHKSGDVHTYVARLVWPELPWNGDLKKDKAIAKRLPEWDNVEGHDFRFQAKRIQHGSNFGLTPPGISMIARIPMKQAFKAQENYFSEFPGIRHWQKETAAEIRDHKPLVNVLGREITLMGRPWDDHTVKQGLAFKPQSSVADILDLAWWRVWNDLMLNDELYLSEERLQRPDDERLEVLAQIHDALLGQVRSGNIEALLKLKALMQIPIMVNGREMIIEAEIAIGRNWGKQSGDNPHGMWEPPELN